MFAGFQSTHPARGATLTAQRRHNGGQISIHAPREGCDNSSAPSLSTIAISIHAPREGCDLVVPQDIQTTINISIHAPREGCDVSLSINLRNASDISIHAPREGCDSIRQIENSGNADFNPRTPRGVRQMFCHDLIALLAFQSTHPARGATAKINKNIVDFRRFLNNYKQYLL